MQSFLCPCWMHASNVGLEYLHLEDNQITDISSLAPLVNLRHLYLDNNQVADISSLASLVNLHWAFLRNNQITDISPLVDNQDLGAEDWAHLQGNPLSVTSCTDLIPILESRLVWVLHDCRLLYP